MDAQFCGQKKRRKCIVGKNPSISEMLLGITGGCSMMSVYSYYFLCRVATHPESSPGHHILHPPKIEEINLRKAISNIKNRYPPPCSKVNDNPINLLPLDNFHKWEMSLFFTCSNWHVAQIDSMPQMSGFTFHFALVAVCFSGLLLQLLGATLSLPE